MSSRMSTSAYLFMMRSGAISWVTKKQTTVATSTCGAKYIAMCAACTEAVWLLRGVSFVLKCETDVESLYMIAGSLSAMKMSNTEGIGRKNKHIDISHHYVCDVVAQN